MNKIQTENNKSSKICPVCGTRISENATRCLVCGTQLSQKTSNSKQTPLQTRRFPEVRLGLPALLGLVLLFLALTGMLIYFIVNSGKAAEVMVPGEVEFTPTLTLTTTSTPSPTSTPTPLPTWTPLPPVQYTVKEGETCSDIAAQFLVSIQSIILSNNLNTDCTINPGLVLMVPQPTLTPSPVPTATPESILPGDDDVCRNTISVTVESGMTLSSIAMNYNVEMSVIRKFNNMSSDIVRAGQVIVVPLCERIPTAGPTLTPTTPPPYPAPNLLLPRSGAAFAATDDTVSLQWASVAELRNNEYYRVMVQDLTSLEEKILVDYVRDTKYILPSSFRPIDTNPHIIQWTVSVARQINQDDNNPIYEEAGLISAFRVFSWVGTGLQTTPSP